MYFICWYAINFSACNRYPSVCVLQTNSENFEVTDIQSYINMMDDHLSLGVNTTEAWEESHHKWKVINFSSQLVAHDVTMEAKLSTTMCEWVSMGR